MTRLSLVLAAVLLSTPLLAADPPTVGSVTHSNGREENGWFLAKTPSILRVKPSEPVAADLRAAITDYDRVLELADAEPRLRAEALRRGAYLRLRLVEHGELDESELAHAIEGYERVLADYPADAANDHALYQLARAHQFAGDNAAAADLLQRLGQRYPASPLRADALFRAAEMRYLAGDYAQAAHDYRQVLDMGDRHPQYEPAQYKYAWSLYQQTEYEAAVPVFLTILERELPPGELDDPIAALSGVGARQAEVAGESLRVLGLSFAALGGGPAVSRHFATRGSEPRFLAMLYASLGTQLQAQRRYTDAAQAFEAFAQQQPRHRLAPRFQRHAIAALEAGGFGELMLAAQSRFVETYAPDSRYWDARTADAATVAEVRTMLESLARHQHARAQQLPAGSAARRAAFESAANHYRRQLDLFADDATAPLTAVLLADAWLEAGRIEDAARQYERSAYDYAAHARSAEAAYAAVQAWGQLADVQPALREPALQAAIASGLKLAERFAEHPQRAATLVTVAQDQYELSAFDPAITQAQRVLDLRPPASLQQQAWTVIADAHFAQSRYAEAEQAYQHLLAQGGAAPPVRGEWQHRVAVTFYRRGEAARNERQWQEAARFFERAGAVAPEPTMRAAADYDAASAWFQLEDWRAAQRSLENFRTRHPAHALTADADRKLAVAYEQDAQWSAAAQVFARIAQRVGETADLQREAAWRSASLYDRAADPLAASRAYEHYVTQHPQPLLPAQQARRRLADLHQRSPERLQQWLRAIVSADQATGSSEPRSRQLAAQASLELGRADAVAAARLSLQSASGERLAQRLRLTQSAVAALDRAAAYGYAEPATAAVYELGAMYRELARALLASGRPAELQALEREQYDLMLEEQAFPFEEKSIAAHEANLKRLRQGLWNEWIQRSSLALADLVPVKYGKRDQRENSYDHLN